jgi:hypothetical protein
MMLIPNPPTGASAMRTKRFGWRFRQGIERTTIIDKRHADVLAQGFEGDRDLVDIFVVTTVKNDVRHCLVQTEFAVVRRLLAKPAKSILRIPSGSSVDITSMRSMAPKPDYTSAVCNNCVNSSGHDASIQGCYSARRKATRSAFSRSVSRI